MTQRSMSSLITSLLKSGADSDGNSPPDQALKSVNSGEMKCSGPPLDQVIKWLVEGHSDGDIVDAIGQFWPDESAEDLINAGLDKITDAGKVEPALIDGWCLMARRELYRRMLEIGDFAGALRATEKIESLVNKKR